jgi:hypothetical protein
LLAQQVGPLVSLRPICVKTFFLCARGACMSTLRPCTFVGCNYPPALPVFFPCFISMLVGLLQQLLSPVLSLLCAVHLRCGSWKSPTILWQVASWRCYLIPARRGSSDWPGSASYDLLGVWDMRPSHVSYGCVIAGSVSYDIYVDMGSNARKVPCAHALTG